MFYVKKNQRATLGLASYRIWLRWKVTLPKGERKSRPFGKLFIASKVCALVTVVHKASKERMEFVAIGESHKLTLPLAC